MKLRTVIAFLSACAIGGTAMAAEPAKSSAVESGCIKTSAASTKELDTFAKKNGKGFTMGDMKLTNNCDYDVTVLLHAVDTLLLGMPRTPGDEKVCQASTLAPGRTVVFRSQLPQRHAAVAAQAASFAPIVCHGDSAGNDSCDCAPGVRKQ